MPNVATTEDNRLIIRLSDKTTEQVKHLADSIYRDVLNDLLGVMLTVEAHVPTKWLGDVEVPKPTIKRSVTQLDATYDAQGKRKQTAVQAVAPPAPVLAPEAAPAKSRKLSAEQMQCRHEDGRGRRTCGARSMGAGWNFMCRKHLTPSGKKRLAKMSAAR